MPNNQSPPLFPTHRHCRLGFKLTLLREKIPMFFYQDVIYRLVKYHPLNLRLFSPFSTPPTR